MRRSRRRSSAGSAAVDGGANADGSARFELALCGRLIKGYGATNERGKRNLAHIVDHLASGGAFATPSARAAAIRQAREAALADEGGKALDQALVAHGAPPRPVVRAADPLAARRGQGTHPARPRHGH